MLTKGDDYPLHQTPEPIAYVGGNRNFYDRYFFNGYDSKGEIFFAMALGVYPYVNILDAGFSVVFKGKQHNVISSKVMKLERLDMQVGPLSVEVLEPMQRLKLTCDDPDSSLACELVFEAFIPAHEEPRFIRRLGSQLTMDLTRMMQNGSWQGWIEVAGERIEVNRTNFTGTRDRSWGIRNIGAADRQPNPVSAAMQFYWIWVPMNFQDFSIHYFVNQDADGNAWNENAVLIPKFGQGPEEVMVEREYKQIYQPGTRYAKSASISLTRPDGRQCHIDLQPKWNFFMKGIGYGHETFSHGTYHSDLAIHREVYTLDEVPPENIHVQAMCDVRLSHDEGQEAGQGIIEQLVIGPHRPSGFSQLLDFAP
ncbi:MAG: hypothetical protein HOL98_02440 [Gammaproteobacteria bacterium]|jgi:hypothetical protein|nr:hypothetical protein [Gammaproteobacteria bacterium]MBT5202291.1 hypothetical protein [Gammaproteobacteria bacterium]MBT5601943.1 hypothetical protein [Gammaproteobacteria bacterium]MBT6245788.1 hypothetical protein [Gammaproteobacteria bacterium]